MPKTNSANNTYLNSTSSEALRKHQTKLTRLSQSIKRDVIHHSFGESLTKKELDILTAAAQILEGSKTVIADAKERKERAEAKIDAQQREMRKAAIEILVESFNDYDKDTLSRLSFILPVNESSTVWEHYLGFEYDLERAQTDNNPQYLHRAINTAYSDLIGRLAETCYYLSDESLRPERVERVIAIVHNAIKNTPAKHKGFINKISWYLAKAEAGELSDNDRAKLGL